MLVLGMLFILFIMSNCDRIIIIRYTIIIGDKPRRDFGEK